MVTAGLCRIGRDWQSLTYQPEDNTENYAEQNTGRNGEIEVKVFSFDGNVSRQAKQPEPG